MSSSPDGAHATTPLSRSSVICDLGEPRAPQQSVGVGPVRVPRHHRDARPCHAGEHRAHLTEPGRLGAARRAAVTASTMAPRAVNCSSSTSSSTVRTGVTQVSAPASSATQASRPRVAKTARNSARIAVLGVVVQLVVYPLRATEQPAEVGEELGFDGPDGQPPTVGRLVGVVTGVAPGDDVLTRTHSLPGGQVLVDSQGGHPQDPVGDGDVEVGAGPVLAPSNDGGHHGQGGLQAPSGGVGDGGTRHRGPAVGPGPSGRQVAPHGQVVDVVAGPGGVWTVLAVSRGGAQDDPRVDAAQIGKPDAEPIDHAGPEALHHDIGRGHQGQEGGPAFGGFQVDGRVLQIARAAVGVERGSDGVGTPARSPPPPSPPWRRSRPGSACNGRPAPPWPGRGRSHPATARRGRREDRRQGPAPRRGGGRRSRERAMGFAVPDGRRTGAIRSSWAGRVCGGR